MEAAVTVSLSRLFHSCAVLKKKEFLHSGFRVLGILKQLLLFWLYLSIGFDVTKFSNCLAQIFLMSFSSGVKWF